jgi:hypothetical protein
VINLEEWQLRKVNDVSVTVEGSQYLQDMIQQNIRYFMTERFSFRRNDLDLLEEFLNPLLGTKYELKDSLTFNSNTDRIVSVD